MPGLSHSQEQVQRLMAILNVSDKQLDIAKETSAPDHSPYENKKSNISNNKQWITDTDASHHICCSSDSFVSFKMH